MVRYTERLLNLHRGDLGRGALLFSYLFLVISSYVVGKVARDALFLDRFRAVELPYADIAIALLVGVVVAGYVRLGRRASLRTLLIGSLLFFAANTVVFWWLAHAYQLPWLFPVIYIWVGIFGVLAPAQVWTLANYVLTTREAKRLFGLVGSGAISGWIFGGFFSAAAVQAFGTEVLLLGMALFLAVCAVLVVFIWRHRQETLPEAEEREESAGEKAPGTLRESMRLVWSSRYMRAIAAVICVSSFVTTMAGWQFKAIAKQFLVEKDALAAFFGNFNFFAGLLSLAVQLFLTSRVLRRFGIGPALLVVPVALLAGSMGVLVWGTLVAAVCLKGSDQVLRYSIDKSTVELLYLPIPANVKIQVKSFIDTVIWRMGDGLAGVTLLIFATFLHLTPPQVSWVLLGLIAGWMSVAVIARRQYVDTLRESIRRHRLDAERASAPVIDRSTSEVILAATESTDPQEILYALSLFKLSRAPAPPPAVRKLLHHADAEVRQKAISILGAAGDKTALPEIEGLLTDPHLEVRTEALLYVTRFSHVDPLARINELGDFADFSLRSGIAAFLARPGPTQNLETARLIVDSMVKQSGPAGLRTRLEAARLMSVLPGEFDDHLRLLLADPDVWVAREAVATVGKLRLRVFLPALLAKLNDPELAPAVVEACVRFGDRIAGTLVDHLRDPEEPLEIRRDIPSVLVRIGTPAAKRALGEIMLERDPVLRFRIVSSLNKLDQTHAGAGPDTHTAEAVLAVEILDQYGSYQALGRLGGKWESEDESVKALRLSMEKREELIFRLLSLLFPRDDLHSAHVGLQSRNAVIHSNALELLDNTLKPQIRKLLLPLVDSEVEVPERIRLAGQIVRRKVGSYEDTIAALVQCDDSWLQSCGAHAIGMLGLKSLEPALEACLNHPDPLLREKARWAKAHLAALPETANA